jgi:hypothetical protein
MSAVSAGRTPSRTATAARRCSGARWLYRMVIMRVWWPSASCTSLSVRPRCTSQDAKVCRRSWKRKFSIPATAKAASQALRNEFQLREPNTYPAAPGLQRRARTASAFELRGTSRRRPLFVNSKRIARRPRQLSTANFGHSGAKSRAARRCPLDLRPAIDHFRDTLAARTRPPSRRPCRHHRRSRRPCLLALAPSPSLAATAAPWEARTG